MGILKFSAEPTNKGVHWFSDFVHNPNKLYESEVLITIKQSKPRQGNGDRVVRPVDVVFVLDVSGSMSGAPIEKLQATVNELIGKLKETDRVAIVKFGVGTTVVQGLTFMSNNNKMAVQSSVSMLHYALEGGTNMCGAYKKAYEMLTNAGERNATKLIVALTDGELHDSGSAPEIQAYRTTHSACKEAKIMVEAFAFNDESGMGMSNINFLADNISTRGICLLASDKDDTLLKRFSQIISIAENVAADFCDLSFAYRRPEIAGQCVVSLSINGETNSAIQPQNGVYRLGRCFANREVKILAVIRHVAMNNIRVMPGKNTSREWFAKANFSYMNESGVLESGTTALDCTLAYDETGYSTSTDEDQPVALESKKLLLNNRITELNLRIKEEKNEAKKQALYEEFLELKKQLLEYGSPEVRTRGEQEIKTLEEAKRNGRKNLEGVFGDSTAGIDVEIDSVDDNT